MSLKSTQKSVSHALVPGLHSALAPMEATCPLGWYSSIQRPQMVKNVDFTPPTARIAPYNTTNTSQQGKSFQIGPSLPS